VEKTGFKVCLSSANLQRYTVGYVKVDDLNAKYDGAAEVGGKMYFGPCHRNNVVGLRTLESS
jgi:hypothetical protein